MKKIYLIRANKNIFGGAENYLSRISRQLKLNNIDYEIIYSKFPMFLPSWFRVFVFNIQLSIFKGNRFYFSLDRISSADVYRAGDGVHKEFLKIKKKSKLNPLHPLYLNLEKKCFVNSQKIIVNSNMVKNQILHNYNINEDKIRIVYNGFDPEKLSYSKSFIKISKEFNITENEFILLFVGSGFKRKGVSNFLNIVSQLNQENIKAFVIGKDSNLESYKKLAKKLLIDKKIFFTGPRSDVNDFYKIGDIFIFPTHYEPFSNVVLEAMAYGNAIFTTKQNGASEIIDPEYIMNSPRDETVIKKINNLLENDSLLSKVKNKNKEVSAKFSVEKNVTETLRILNEVIN